MNNDQSSNDIIELISSYQNSPPGNITIDKQKQHTSSKAMNVVHSVENLFHSASTSPTTISDDEYNDIILFESNNDINLVSIDFNTSTISMKLKILFTLLGMGTLCPYNAIISCIDWFQSYLNDDAIESQLAASCITSLVITTVLLLSTINKSENILSTSSNRMYIGFILDILLLFIFIITKPSRDMLLLLSFGLGIADAVSQSGVYATAASIDSQCSAYTSLGSSLSGVLISVIRMICMSVTDDARIGSMLFFSIVVLFICVCLYVSTRIDQLQTIDFDNQISSHSQDIEESNAVQILPSTTTTYHTIFLKVWNILFCMTFNFFITLSLFPGVITSIPSIDYIVSNDWMPIVLITTFNLFDFIGRIILTDTFGWVYLIQLLLPKEGGRNDVFTFVVFIPCLLRILFLPITIYVVPIFSDVITCILVGILGLSNGFITSACFMNGPNVVPKCYKEDVSLWLLLSLYVGLLLGAFSGMLFV